MWFVKESRRMEVPRTHEARGIRVLKRRPPAYRQRISQGLNVTERHLNVFLCVRYMFGHP